MGQLEPTGLRPNFLYKFEKRGVSLPNDIFLVPGVELPDYAKVGVQ